MVLPFLLFLPPSNVLASDHLCNNTLDIDSPLVFTRTGVIIVYVLASGFLAHANNTDRNNSNTCSITFFRIAHHIIFYHTIAIA